jgi:hypothetical protein
VGTWQLVVADGDILAINAAFRTAFTAGGTTRHRLIPGLIEDLAPVCHYVVTG